jgi:hypothetical protein
MECVPVVCTGHVDGGVKGGVVQSIRGSQGLTGGNDRAVV